MTYVPAGLPASAYRDDTVHEWQTIYVNNNPPTTPSKVVRNLEWRQAVKVGSKGKKVKYAFGYWSPVRPYQRSAQVCKLTGSYQEDKATNGVRYVSRGLPWYYVTNPLNFQEYGNGVVYNGVPLPVDANTRNRLITECILKIGDQKAQVGEFLAESGKAINHLAHTAISLLRALLALRRGNFRGVAKALGVSFKPGGASKTAASRWLEYQYAWLPLMSDMYDFANVAKNGLGKKPPLISAVRNLSDTYPWRQLGNQGVCVMTGETKINRRCKLWYRLDDATLYRLNQLSLINPLAIAWELVPFSFVIDWFLPVGNVLNAWSATMGLTYLDGVITSRQEGKASGEYKSPTTDVRIAGGFRYEFSSKGIRRENVSSPTPGLYFKSPFSTTHVLSALALIRNLRK